MREIKQLREMLKTATPTEKTLIQKRIKQLQTRLKSWNDFLAN